MALKTRSGSYDWLQPSPTFVDHFAVQEISYSKMVRMSFGEHVGKNLMPIYRIGLAMPLYDAKELMKALGLVIAKMEGHEEEIEEDLDASDSESSE